MPAHNSGVLSLSLMLGSALSVMSAPVFAKALPESIIAPSADAPDDLLNVALEDLLVLESTSVAKKRQSVDDSAAAVYVISQEDISNSPAGTIPDLLRVVPGVEVAQIANGAVAVSIRGFNGRNSNSLLVMIDGRTIYVSTLSGVFWDQLNLPLQDIERIEVVRGPGATLWGANAVNGVINIITKHSGDTLGARAHGRVGNRRQEGVLSYGARLAEDATVRAHGTFRNERGLQRADGSNLGAASQSGEAGLRLDYEPSERDALTLQVDYSAGSVNTDVLIRDQEEFAPFPIEVAAPIDFETFNVLGRWRRKQSENLDWSAQAYFSKLDRTELPFGALNWSIADLDLGANWRPDGIHDINFGFGVRAIWDEIEVLNLGTRFDPQENTDTWISGYIQDDISLVPDKLRLTLGAKLERNNFTGFEFQPGARLFFRPSKTFALWGAVTRAVRNPSRFERDGQLDFIVAAPGTRYNPSPLALLPNFRGSDELESENLTAFELGARTKIAGNWRFDVTGYYSKYDDLTEPVPLGVQPIFVEGSPFPVALSSLLELQSLGTARTWGVEALLKGNVTPWWSAQVSYSYFEGENGFNEEAQRPFVGFLDLDASPNHQAVAINNFQIGSSLALNTQLRYVAELMDGRVPDYVAGDLRLRWDAPNGLEFSLIGENLFSKRRLEFAQESYPAPLSFNPRSASIEMRYRF